MIRVELPGHLRALARVKGEVTVEVAGTVSVLSVLNAVEAQYPMLRGTIRDHVTQQRRPFLRFFACGEDLSHEPTDSRCRRSGKRKEPLLVGRCDCRRLMARFALEIKKSNSGLPR
jgi:hypothetical protein